MHNFVPKIRSSYEKDVDNGDDCFRVLDEAADDHHHDGHDDGHDDGCDEREKRLPAEHNCKRLCGRFELEREAVRHHRGSEEVEHP